MNIIRQILAVFVLFVVAVGSCRPSALSPAPTESERPLLTLVYGGGLGGNISSCG